MRSSNILCWCPTSSWSSASSSGAFGRTTVTHDQRIDIAPAKISLPHDDAEGGTRPKQEGLRKLQRQGQSDISTLAFPLHLIRPSTSPTAISESLPISKPSSRRIALSPAPHLTPIPSNYYAIFNHSTHHWRCSLRATSRNSFRIVARTFPKYRFILVI
jgi:hypothetical protein